MVTVTRNVVEPVLCDKRDREWRTPRIFAPSFVPFQVLLLSTSSTSSSSSSSSSSPSDFYCNHLLSSIFSSLFSSPWSWTTPDSFMSLIKAFLCWLHCRCDSHLFSHTFFDDDDVLVAANKSLVYKLRLRSWRQLNLPSRQESLWSFNHMMMEKKREKERCSWCFPCSRQRSRWDSYLNIEWGVKKYDIRFGSDITSSDIVIPHVIL